MGRRIGPGIPEQIPFTFGYVKALRCGVRLTDARPEGASRLTGGFG